MPIERNMSAMASGISLEEIRQFYFYNTKRTLRIEDAKYLQERAGELGLTSKNGGVEALFKTLKYDFGDLDN